MLFVAEKIQTAVNFIADTDQNKIPVFFSGGISKQYEMLFPMIEKHLSDCRLRLILQEKEPIEGALHQAITIYNETQKGK